MVLHFQLRYTQDARSRPKLGRFGERERTARWLAARVSAAPLSRYAWPLETYIGISQDSSVQYYIIDLEVGYHG
jgi:hypothetical protein